MYHAAKLIYAYTGRVTTQSRCGSSRRRCEHGDDVRRSRSVRTTRFLRGGQGCRIERGRVDAASQRCRAADRIAWPATGRTRSPALREQLREAEEERDSLERGGEKLAVQVRGYLAEAIKDDLDHPATRSPLAQGLNAWNDARNSLRPDRNEEARSGSLPDEEAG
jgi:hypothetical protein